MEHQNQASEVKRALQEKVLLDDGRIGFVFSELVQIGPSNRWHCHVCSRTVDSERALVMHLSHPLHTIKLRVCEHPAKNFKKFADDEEDKDSSRKDISPISKTEGAPSTWEMSTDVLPGEPVPPGMEDVVEGLCQIQATFDEHPGPLIGLEYIVELITSEEESEPRYICLLCEKKGDPRSLMVHVTSQNHCLKYISCFFRTAGNALNMIPRTVENRKGIGIAIMKIAEEIEKNYGRLKPTSAVAETFTLKKYEILRQIDEKEHFRETPTTTFAHYVTPEKIMEYSEEDDQEGSESPNKKNPLFGHRFFLLANKAEKPLLKPLSDNEKIKMENYPGKVIDITGENDPIEVTSSVSSASSPITASDDDAQMHMLSSDRFSSSRKQRITPELDEHQKYLYHSSIRRGISPPSLRLTKQGARSRSRERDMQRRVPKYYRERSRRSRSPSFGRRRFRRSRYEDRLSEERYRRKTPDRYELERARERATGYDRKRRDSRERHDRSRRESRERQDRGRRESRERLDRVRRDSRERYDRIRRDSRERLDRSRRESRERRDRRDRSRSGPPDKKKESLSKWDKYRSELHKLEIIFATKLKYFEERPEKHPRYSDEWKGFWNKRYKEIQLSGKDPTTYDFKPEWIVYWAKRMKELSGEDFNKEREALRKKIGVDEKPEKDPSIDLQDISPPTPESQRDVTVDDIKNTWKALTGTEITAPNHQSKASKRSPSPWESVTTTTTSVPAVSSQITDSERASISSRKPYDIAPPVLHCLRMLSVLEHQLGSLGPKVMELLSKAIILERQKYNSSMTLLKDADMHIFFETVKEKIRAQLIAGIVVRNLVSSCRAIIKAIETMLNTNPPEPSGHLSLLAPTQSLRIPPPALQTSEPVQVPGIGMIDKMAVAQQIASALVTQGKTDVTQEELEDLINAVVGIAKASNANVSKNISSAAFFSQLNIENSTAASHINEILSNMITSAQKSLGMEPKQQVDNVESTPQPVGHPVQEKVIVSTSAVLNTMQAVSTTQSMGKHNVSVTSATTTTTLSKEQPSLVPKIQPSGTSQISKDVSDEDLKDKLMKFSSLSRDEQQNLIALLRELETSQASRVENLRKYVSIGLVQKVPEKGNLSREGSKDGRLSPFSSRVGGANPTPDDSQKGKRVQLSPNIDEREDDEDDDDDDDDDDDYSVEDVYKAASEKLFKKNESSTLSQGGLSTSKKQDYDKSSTNKGYGMHSNEKTSSQMSTELPSSSILTYDGALSSNVANLMENLYGRNDSYQISMSNQPQNDTRNSPFMGNSYKSYQQEQFSEGNYYNAAVSDSNNSQDFRGASSFDNNYNNRDVNYGGYSETSLHSQQYDGESRNAGMSWEYANTAGPNMNRSFNDNFKNDNRSPGVNYQQQSNNRIVPQPNQNFFRGPQNTDQSYCGYRQNY